VEAYLVESEPTPPSQIESKLNTIWEKSQGATKLRASLFNLIVYTHKNKRVDYMTVVIDKLLERFPSRVLFITVDDSSDEEIMKTGVALVPVGEGVACDLITIELSRKTKERAPFLILPHLLTDLPIYLMWAADPEEDRPISSAIERFATKVIFDSESSGKIDCFAGALLAHHTAENLPISDLNWARVKPWRTMLSTVFSEKEKTPLLEHMKEIHIEYSKGSAIQALYLQGWIAIKLGWEMQTTGHDEETLCIGYEGVSVFLTPKESKDLPAGAILSVRLITAQEETCHFQRRQDNPGAVSFEMTTPEKCEIPLAFAMDKYESGQSLLQEIFNARTSNSFLSLLPLMKTLSC